MKYILLLSILSTLPAFANNCETYYAFQKDKILARCILEDQDKAIEYVKLKEHCSKVEGATKQDCFIVRDCPKNKETRYSQAPIILPQYLTDDTYCSKEKYQTVLNKPSKKISAKFKCQNQKPVSIELKLNSKTKICDLN